LPEADIERILSSVGRLRIMKYLGENPRKEASLSLYRLRVLTGLKLSDIRRHIDLLVKYGWVKEVGIRDQNKYQLNWESPIVKALFSLYEVAGYT
jgi:DNA-binding IclR family transcriptional regulator